MQRAVLPVIAALLALSCTDITAPDPVTPTVVGPSLASTSGPSDTECGAGGTIESPGTLPAPGPYQNVIVPEDGLCVLIGLEIRGNVKALARSTTQMIDNDVAGNVQADGVRGILIFGGSVGGSIDIAYGLGGSIFNEDYHVEAVLITRNIHVIKNVGEVRITGNLIPSGNVKVEENHGEIASADVGLLITGNSVGQNLQVFKNTGETDKHVQGNIVGQNIQCYENQPPFVGIPNTTPRPEQQERQCGVPPTPQ